MNKKTTKFNADSRQEALNLKLYDRKESGRKPKVSRKGGNRRQPKWIELAAEAEDDLIVAPASVEEEPEDWFFFNSSQGEEYQIANSPEIPYPVGVAMIHIALVPRYVVYAVILNRCVVLDTFISPELMEESLNFIEHQPRHEQLRMAQSYAPAQWWQDDVLDLKVAGFKVL